MSRVRFQENGVIVALMPVRNEAWCLGLTLRALLMWVDRVIVMNHASTDETNVILSEIRLEQPGRIMELVIDTPVWEEMKHRQAMLEAARVIRATHIVLVDADEILTGPIGEMKELVRMTPPHVMLQLPWVCLDSTESYYSSGMWSEQMVSIAFKDDPACHWAARNGYDFHHRHPMGVSWRNFRLRNRDGGLMHLQFINKRRLKAKQYLYQITERLRWPDRDSVEDVRARYSATVQCALMAQTKPIPASWWAPYEHLMRYLHVDERETPWQEIECRQILYEYPGIGDGLDDFGLKL